MKPKNELFRIKEEELKLWAIEQGILKNGDTLEITFTIKKAPRAKVTICSGPNFHRLKPDHEYELKDHDWEAIFAIDLSGPQRKFLEKLRASGNSPVSADDPMLNTSIKEDMRTRIHKAGLKYSLRKIDPHVHWDDMKYKMFKLV